MASLKAPFLPLAFSSAPSSMVPASKLEALSWQSSGLCPNIKAHDVFTALRDQTDAPASKLALEGPVGAPRRLKPNPPEK